MALDRFVELYKKIKKSNGWTSYKMAKELGISQTQLQHYEKQPISTRELILVRLFEVSDIPLPDFWEALSKEAKDARKRRLKAKLDDL